MGPLGESAPATGGSEGTLGMEGAEAPPLRPPAAVGAPQPGAPKLKKESSSTTTACCRRSGCC